MFVYYGYAFPLSTRIAPRVLPGRRLVRQRVHEVGADLGGVVEGRAHRSRWCSSPTSGASPGGSRCPGLSTARPGGCSGTGSRRTTSTSGGRARSGSQGRAGCGLNLGPCSGRRGTTSAPIMSVTYGSATYLEGLSQGQPGHHSGEGVPGDRIGRGDLLQPASRRVPDAHPAEELVPALRARGAEHRARQGLRVREGPLRRRDRRGHPEGARRIDARHRPRAVHRRHGDRSDLRRSRVLPGAGRSDGRRLRSR